MKNTDTIKVTYSKSAIPLILESFDKTTDTKGYVIDIKTKEFVLDIDGKKFKANKLMGIKDDKWYTNIFQYSK